LALGPQKNENGGPAPPPNFFLEAKSSEVRTGAIAPLLAGDFFFFVFFDAIFGTIFDQKGHFSLFFDILYGFLSFF